MKRCRDATCCCYDEALAWGKQNTMLMREHMEPCTFRRVAKLSYPAAGNTKHSRIASIFQPKCWQSRKSKIRLWFKRTDRAFVASLWTISQHVSNKHSNLVAGFTPHRLTLNAPHHPTAPSNTNQKLCIACGCEWEHEHVGLFMGNGLTVFPSPHPMHPGIASGPLYSKKKKKVWMMWNISLRRV